MTVPERLTALRQLMKEHHVDAYLVPTDDFHCSEYVGEYFKCRKYITGFTGSAGTAVITQTEAGLWTDGRYFIQAAAQLEGTGVTLFRMGTEGCPTVEEYLIRTLQPGQCLGFDGRTVSSLKAEALECKLAEKQVSISFRLDLVGDIWTDRPALSHQPAWAHSEIYTGRSRKDKIAEVRKAMADKGADEYLLSSLDDIAWLLNIRGNDIRCNPVVLSYVAVTHAKVYLFAQKESVSDELENELRHDGITLKPYNDVYSYAASIPSGKKLLLCCASSNYTLKKSISQNVTVIDDVNPTELPKAMKNPVEIANARKAHIRDGVAVTKFIYWLKQNIGKTEITELSATEKLEELRRADKNYLGPSFEPILSYGAHAAIVHYSATPETDIPLQPMGMVLADTGGQYLEGTTDVTRTIVLGNTTEKEKEFFTRVLRGNLNLASARFLYGCTGVNLDYLAREPLWEIGEDFNHGTGHGVGSLLNVHEGPNSFYYKKHPSRKNSILEEGMITSDEPGFYLEGEFGIRHETLILCKKAEKKACGQFMEFEPLTLVPFDLEAVLPEQMTDKERARLNAYHQKVYEKISPYLTSDEKEWLRESTRSI